MSTAGRKRTCADADLPVPEAKSTRAPPLGYMAGMLGQREQSLGYLGWLPDDVLGMVAAHLFMSDIELLSELPAPMPAICRRPAIREAFRGKQLAALDDVRLLNWIRLATAGGGSVLFKSEISAFLTGRFTDSSAIKQICYATAFKLLWHRDLPNIGTAVSVCVDHLIAELSGDNIGGVSNRSVIYPIWIALAILCRGADNIRAIQPPISESACPFDALYLLARMRGQNIVGATLQAFDLENASLTPLYDCMIRVGSEHDVVALAKRSHHAAVEALRCIPMFRHQSTVDSACTTAQLSTDDIIYLLDRMIKQRSPHAAAVARHLTSITVGNMVAAAHRRSPLLIQHLAPMITDSVASQFWQIVYERQIPSSVIVAIYDGLMEVPALKRALNASKLLASFDDIGFYPRLFCNGAVVVPQLVFENLKNVTFVEFVISAYAFEPADAAQLFFGIYDLIVQYELHEPILGVVDDLAFYRRALQRIAEKYSLPEEYFVRECMSRLAKAPVHIATMMSAYAKCVQQKVAELSAAKKVEPSGR